MSASREGEVPGKRSVPSADRASSGRAPLLGVLLAATTMTFAGACALAGFGSSLELNITDLQTRPLLVRVEAPSGARIVESRSSGDVELGTGSATIERYVLQRATFGRGVGTGLFLCETGCERPLDTFLVASSSEQLFAPVGELRLQFRMETEGGVEEVSRIVTPAMLEDLWGDAELRINLR